MMKSIEAILALALLPLSCDAIGEQPSEPDASLLANPDFESFSADGKAVGWSVPSDKWRVMRGEGMNGSCGLVFENRDDSAYRDAAQQRVSVEAGGVYRFGAWVKVDEVSGSDSFLVALGWWDKDGKWLGQTLSPSVSKKGDWTKIEAISKPLSPGATTARLQIFAQPGTFGRAVFDRVYMERHVRHPVIGVYCAAYRAEAWEGEVKFAAALTPEAFGVAPEKTEVCCRVRCPDGTSFSLGGIRPAADEARVVIPIERFSVGTNEVTCVLSSDGRELGRSAMKFVRAVSPTPRRVSIDRYGRAIMDGVPFFPLGMYSTGHLSDKQLARYADSDFNCIMQYGNPTTAEMKAFQKKGLKVIYDVGSKYRTPDAGTNMVRHAIGKFAQHPALLAWYIYDEQPTSAIPALEARQRLVETLDPDHPTWCAQDISEETRYYLNACDVFGGDPYPVSAHPIDMATKAIRQETKGLMGMRPIWQVVQAFGWNWIRKSQEKHQRRPTEAEIRNMAWQAIAGGARGLVFYSYSHYCRDDLPCREPVEVLWPEMKRIAAELKSHENTLLMAETYGIPDADLPSGVVGRIWKNGNVTWRLLVNTSASVEITALGTTLPPLGVSLIRL